MLDRYGLPLSTSSPIMLGGIVRYLAERTSRKKLTEAEAESGPGVLVSSGLIAGGSIGGMLVAFASGASDSLMSKVNLGKHLPNFAESNFWAFALFLGMAAFLYLVANEYLLKPADDDPGPAS